MTEDIAKGKVFKVREAKAKQYRVDELVFPEYKNGDTVVLFDGDILAFKVSSVCEFKFLYTHRFDKSEQYRVKSQKEFKGFLADTVAELYNQLEDADEAETLSIQKQIKFWSYDNFDIEKIQEAEPFSFCAKTLKSGFNNVMNNLKADYSELYMGGSENFRLDIPLIEKYKSSRSESERPIHLTAAKQALTGAYFNGKFITGIEADDLLQMRQKQLHDLGVNVVMYSNDKDRLQGWYGKYYNPDDLEVMELKSRLGEITESKKGSGLHWLLFQCSQGDKVDCYSPKGWFSKFAYKRGFGQKSYYEAFHDAVDEKDLLTKWIDLHKTKLLVEDFYEWEDFKGRKVKANWLGIVELMFNCAYMKLSIGDKTTFTSMCKEFDVDAGECILEVDGCQWILE